MKNIIGRIGLFFILFSPPLSAAAPGAHVHFAKLWMDVNGVKGEAHQHQFTVGTLFPDIRYLGTVSRRQTHEEGVTAKKIRNTACLVTAGMRLHVFVDESRERFVKNYDVLSQLKEIPKQTRVLFLKLIEDEILWERVHCAETILALNTIYPEEVAKGVNATTVEEWHRTMQLYFMQRPSEFLKQKALRGEEFLNADAKTVKKWSDILPTYASDPYFIEYTVRLEAYLKKLF